MRMISEGSCDTEDWSNDAENSKLYLNYKKIENNCNNISQYYCLYYIFNQISAQKSHWKQTFKFVGSLVT